MGCILKLPERLMAAVNFIEQGAYVADIGTDHGYLPVYLALHGSARGIIASDISEGSLKTARQSAAKYGVAEKITFISAAGLDGIEKTDADTVVVTGLGGETIASILGDSPWIKRRNARLILQPQSKIGELCDFLRTNGYRALDARLAYDNGRFYVILLVVYGKTESEPDRKSEPEPEIEILSLLMHKRDPMFTSFLDTLIAKKRRVLENIEKANVPTPDNIRHKLAEYIELKEEYKNDYCK
ncbi:MAG: class I SAM-dependent methyltransferase [Oscillospiraceae bacterium]|nr:class I SAM-dependent methyltransferase [Oscillospiraceae bacterium]